MDRDEALRLLGRGQQGIEVWNRHRQKSDFVLPDLAEADLAEADLSGANLSGAVLYGADLSGANLSGANLSKAVLYGADLGGACLYAADLDGANLNGADLNGADLSGADLSDADLSETNLSGVKLHGTKLYGADLYGANLNNADLDGAGLSDANLDGAVVSFTHFADIDLSQARGLESVVHEGPSSIGIDTVIESEGKIPEVFLRGCGVPDVWIANIPALIGAMQPIQFYSVFISYSHKDEEFAERLHDVLQGKGVRCWYAPHDLPIGARIRPTIDESIRVHDKLLLVLSESSVASQWVEQEVETALRRERDEPGKTVLFPVRLDDAVFSADGGWASLVCNTRNIGDFRQWKDHEGFKRGLERLLKDLKAEGPPAADQQP